MIQPVNISYKGLAGLASVILRKMHVPVRRTPL